MIEAALRYLAGLTRPTTTEVGDRAYWTESRKQVIPPAPNEITVHTLTGIVDWLEAAEIDIDKTPVLVHVASHEEVHAFTHYDDMHGQRFSWVRAKAAVEAPRTLDRFSEIQEFRIMLASRFQASDDKDYLTRILQRITTGSVRTSEDDGISQTVTVKREGGKLEGEEIRPILHLAPYRTFPEVTQPITPYLLRLDHEDEEKQPMVALFSADGGMWRNKAIDTIRRYLETEIEDKLGAFRAERIQIVA